MCMRVGLPHIPAVYEALYGDSFLGVVLNGGDSTILTRERQFGGRNELLTRLGPLPVSSRLLTNTLCSSVDANGDRNSIFWLLEEQ